MKTSGALPRGVDYRKVRTTSHTTNPNHVFCIRDEIWVTRFEQRDAISLSDPGRRIDIGLERVHDGVVHGDYIYFTTVDGKIVLVSIETLTVKEIIDTVEASQGAAHCSDGLEGSTWMEEACGSDTLGCAQQSSGRRSVGRARLQALPADPYRAL